MQSLSGPITSSGCAAPDLVESLFQTRQPTQYCEWSNGVNGRDAVCYCGTNECNAKEMLENWIQNGGGCKLFIFSILFHYIIYGRILINTKMCMWIILTFEFKVHILLIVFHRKNLNISTFVYQWPSITCTFWVLQTI